MTMTDSETINILIVDDLPGNIHVLGNILQEEGYTISFATNGKQALQMVLSDSYELILLDVMMPEMDGFEVARRLKEMPEREGVPIIFLTAKTEGEDIVKGFELGAVDYVTKPFNPAELLARVHTHLELKRARDRIQLAYAELADKNRQLSLLNEELHKALKEIKTLQGFLPICANCKKIRKEGAPAGEQDSWVVLERYLQDHTGARFTHSICPECIRKLYPEIAQERMKKGPPAP
jgi:sigma-B regulation protein RsbU (phosphoserine phosphatase)